MLTRMQAQLIRINEKVATLPAAAEGAEGARPLVVITLTLSLTWPSRSIANPNPKLNPKPSSKPSPVEVYC